MTNDLYGYLVYSYLDVYGDALWPRFADGIVLLNGARAPVFIVDLNEQEHFCGQLLKT